MGVALVYPDLQKQILSEKKEWKAGQILIENKGSDTSRACTAMGKA